MIACHCNVVRDDEIRTEVRLGASTVEEITARCGAAGRCGGCVPTVEAILVDEVRRSHVAIGAVAGR